MRAMQVVELGRPLELAEVAVPEPGPGEVLLRVHACGLNFADTLIAAGRYQEKPEPPFTPGIEICGTVAALGPGSPAPRREPGSPASPGAAGSPNTSRWRPSAARRPGAMPDEEAAGFLVAYGTSHVALAWRRGCGRRDAAGARRLRRSGPDRGRDRQADGRPGDRRGARRRRSWPIAGRRERTTWSTPATTSAPSEGARRRRRGLRPGGRRRLRCGARAPPPGARLLPLGFAGGEVPQIPANILLVKNLTVSGSTWALTRRWRPRVVAASFATLFAWYVQGRLQPHVSDVLPLEAAKAGLDLLRNRRATGKVVVRVDGRPIRRRGTPPRRRPGAAAPRAARRAPPGGRR